MLSMTNDSFVVVDYLFPGLSDWFHSESPSYLEGPERKSFACLLICLCQSIYDS